MDTQRRLGRGGTDDTVNTGYTADVRLEEHRQDDNGRLRGYELRGEKENEEWRNKTSTRHKTRSLEGHEDEERLRETPRTVGST